MCQPVYGPTPPSAHLAQVEFVLTAALSKDLQGIAHAKDTYIDWGRNFITRSVYEKFPEFTHLLWVDGDIIPPVNGLATLLDHERELKQRTDEPVGSVGGLYFKKGPPYEPVAYDFERKEDGLFQGTYERTLKLDLATDALYLVHGLGFGFTLISRACMDAVNEKTQGTFFQTTVHYGEDVWFYHWAHQLGFTTYLDTSVRCRHIGDYEFTLSDWESHRDST